MTVLESVRKGGLLVVQDARGRLGGTLLAMVAEAVSTETFEVLERLGGARCQLALFWSHLHELGISPGIEPVSALRSGALTLSFNGSLSAEDRVRLLRFLAISSRGGGGDPGVERKLLATFAGSGLKLRPEESYLRSAAHEAILSLLEEANRAPVAVCVLVEDGAGGAPPVAGRVRQLAREREPAEISLDELLALHGEPLVSRKVLTRLPTVLGEFQAVVYEASVFDGEHMVLSMGDVADGEPVLTRIHSECLTGDVLGSLRCDCGPQLELALRMIAEEGRGLLIYLRQEGRGIGLFNKMRAYRLQDGGLDTVEANLKLGFPADLRDFRLAADILDDLGVKRIRLLTNNLRKLSVLEQHGIRVSERVPVVTEISETNRFYLETKRQKLGHVLPVGSEEGPSPERPHPAETDPRDEP